METEAFPCAFTVTVPPDVVNRCNVLLPLLFPQIVVPSNMTCIPTQALFDPPVDAAAYTKYVPAVSVNDPVNVVYDVDRVPDNVA